MSETNVFKRFSLSVFQLFVSLFRMILVTGIMTGAVTYFVHYLTNRNFGYMNIVIIVSSYVFFTSFTAFLVEFIFAERRKAKRQKAMLAKFQQNETEATSSTPSRVETKKLAKLQK